jgi:CRP-like cAMP-binding protein/tRNA A-37 threonylcarbamoyl transferase component Bud32
MSGRATEELAPGTTFGRYAVVRRIGTGGMAAVYEAKQTDIGKRVALKVLHRWLSLREEVVQRFVQEARAASRIEHPHVLSITDIGMEQNQPFIAMELLEGEELTAVLQREGALPVRRIADILLPVISAVAAAHDQGILHRDLKPENIFLARRRPLGEKPILVDFGISKVHEGGTTGLTGADELLGTPPYMSPEQVQHGMASLDARSDQYALGVILYEAATGGLPFPDDGPVIELLKRIARGGADPLSSRSPSIPRAFEAIVARAMNVSRDDRFPHVRDLGGALLPFASPMVQALWAEEFGVTPAPPPEEPARRTLAPPAALRPDDLRAVTCLHDASDDELSALLALAPGARLAARQPLFTQGDPGESMFLLLSGEVDVLEDGGGESVLRATVKPGALLGAPALTDPAPRPVSAIAWRGATVVEIAREVFEELPARLPAIASRLLDQLAVDGIRRLRTASARLADLGARDAPGRTASLAYLAAAIAEWSIPIDAEGGVRRRRSG